MLGDSIKKRASVAVGQIVVAPDDDETLVEEMTVDLVTDLHGETKHSWSKGDILVSVNGILVRLRYEARLRVIEEAVERQLAKKGKPLPGVLLDRCVLACENLLGLEVRVWLISKKRVISAGVG